MHLYILRYVALIQSSLNGWGATLVDSLDTMVIMGLDDHVRNSMAHVAQMRFDEVWSALWSFAYLLPCSSVLLRRRAEQEYHVF